MNVVWVIVAGVVGFWVGRKSVERFSIKSSEALAGLRKEAQEALEERTEKRKEQIVEMIKELAVQQKIVESCDIENKKKGVERTDVEKRLGVSRSTALRYLNELEKEGKIKQVGLSGKRVFYVLK